MRRTRLALIALLLSGCALIRGPGLNPGDPMLPVRALTVDGQPVGIEADPKWEAAGGTGCVTTVREMKLLTVYKLKADSPLRKAGVNLRKLGIDAGPKAGAADVGAE